jgi:prepilin-type N-terminal cleavage/methylation domain-containing protein
VKQFIHIGSTRGFTLLEILVAMAIVGFGVVTLLEIFSLGLRLGAKSSVRTETVTSGRQVMDEFLVRRKLQDGAEQGTLNGQSRWKIQVRPADIPAVERSLASAWELKEVALDMLASDGGQDKPMEFKTLRLVKKK